MPRILHLFLITVFTFVGFSSSAQKMKKVNQSYYNVKYSIPKTWSIDGFGSDDDWEVRGSSVCDCSGTINTGPDDMYMVVYPALKENASLEKRSYIWRYQFSDVDTSEQVKTEKYTFQKKVSGFVKNNNEEDYFNDYVVWQLTVSTKKYFYYIYFFGPTETMDKNSKVIAKILKSFWVN